MNAQFCSQCGSQKLTDATLYLPLDWLVRGLIFVILLVVVRSLRGSLVPFVEREWEALLTVVNRAMPDIECALERSRMRHVFLLAHLDIRVIASLLLSSDIGKPIQNTLRSSVGLLIKIVKNSLCGLLRVIGQILFGNSKLRST